MENKSQTQIYAMMLALVIIILALALAPAVNEATGAARNVSVGDTVGMDCSNSTISDFNKAACIATDISLFYFIGILIFIAGGVIVARFFFD